MKALLPIPEERADAARNRLAVLEAFERLCARHGIENVSMDAVAAEAILGGEPVVILSFGYPATPRNPAARSVGEWSERANRKPLDGLVRRI